MSTDKRVDAKTWTNDELRALYLQIESEVLETDPVWWAECLKEVRRVLEAEHDDAAFEILKAAGWGDPSLGPRLRTLAGVPKREYPCPHCSGSGHLLR